MLVDFKKILDYGEKGAFAVPAFNVYNMETVMGVIAAAEENRSPVIMQLRLEPESSPLLLRKSSSSRQAVTYFFPKSSRMLSFPMKSSVPPVLPCAEGASSRRAPHHLQYFASGLLGLLQLWQCFIYSTAMFLNIMYPLLYG